MVASRLQIYWSSHVSLKTGLARHSPHAMVGTLGWMAKAVADMYRTDLHRRALAQLDEHLLTDIGTDRDTVQREAARAPWNPPLRQRRGG